MQCSTSSCAGGADAGVRRRGAVRYRHRFTTPRWSFIAAGVFGVVPKSSCSPIGVLRTPTARPRRRCARRHQNGRRGCAVRTPLCCSPPPTCPDSCCTSRCARTCSCRCRPVHRPPWPGAAVLANLSGSPITIGRAETAACWPLTRQCAVWRPTSMPRPVRASRPPTWPGTARPYLRERGVLGQSERPPRGRAALHRRRRLTCYAPERARMGPSRTTADTWHTGTRCSGGGVQLGPPAATSGLRRSKSSGFRSCQRIRPGCTTIATRRTTSRCPGWSSGCALIYPKVELGLPGGLDSTHALIVAARAMDREGRPRSGRRSRPLTTSSARRAR